MVGAALHDDVTAFEMHLFAIEHQPDLPLRDHAVIEGFGAVHQLVLGVSLPRAGMGLAYFGEGRRRILGADLVLHAVRRNIHHADDTAQRCRAQLKRFAGGVVAVIQRGRAGATVPDLMEDRAGYGLEREAVGRRSAERDHRPALGIMPGDHAFETRKLLHVRVLNQLAKRASG
ncbi:hypothetical protein D3C84_771480 [compost metagenome]